MQEITFDDLERVDYNYLKSMAEKIGKTNRMWNSYQALLDQAEMFKEHGLDPVVLSTPDGRFVTVTSEQYLQRKLN